MRRETIQTGALACEDDVLVAPLREDAPAALGPAFQPPVELHTEALRKHLSAQECERTEPERLAAHGAEPRGAKHAVEHLRRDHVDQRIEPATQAGTTAEPLSSSL